MHIHIIKCCRRLCFRIHSMPENISLLLFSLTHSLCFLYSLHVYSEMFLIISLSLFL